MWSATSSSASIGDGRPSTSGSCPSASRVTGVTSGSVPSWWPARRRGPASSGLRKVSLGVFPDNERAIAVYERRGFVREGVRRQQYRSGDEFRDEVLMAWFPLEDQDR